MTNECMLRDKTERIWLWSDFKVNVSRYWSDLSFLWTPGKKQTEKTKKTNWKTLYGVPILYTVKKGGDGGGGGEVRGAFEQVLRGHIFHVTLFSIALQSGLFKPSSFFRHFFNLSLFFYGLFITHPPIARSRRSRWNDFFPLSSLKNQLLSLFPEK